MLYGHSHFFGGYLGDYRLRSPCPISVTPVSTLIVPSSFTRRNAHVGMPDDWNCPQAIPLPRGFSPPFSFPQFPCSGASRIVLLRLTPSITWPVQFTSPIQIRSSVETPWDPSRVSRQLCPCERLHGKRCLRSAKPSHRARLRVVRVDAVAVGLYVRDIIRPEDFECAHVHCHGTRGSDPPGIVEQPCLPRYQSAVLHATRLQFDYSGVTGVEDAINSSSRVITIFTGLPDFWLNAMHEGSRSTSDSLPPKPPPPSGQ